MKSFATIAVVGAAIVLAGCGFHGNSPGDAGPGGPPDTGLQADASDGDAPAIDGPTVTPDATPAPSFKGDWFLPCSSTSSQMYCPANSVRATVAVDGAATDHWHVTVRIRGEMAENMYGGGTATTTGWYAGGLSQNSVLDVFSLTVSAPAGLYYLNAGTDAACCTHGFDYTADLDVDGGATLTLDAKPGDAYIWKNEGGLTVPGIATTPDPYDGQFAHFDVVAITPR